MLIHTNIMIIFSGPSLFKEYCRHFVTIETHPSAEETPNVIDGADGSGATTTGGTVD